MQLEQLKKEADAAFEAALPEELKALKQTSKEKLDQVKSLRAAIAKPDDLKDSLEAMQGELSRTEARLEEVKAEVRESHRILGGTVGTAAQRNEQLEARVKELEARAPCLELQIEALEPQLVAKEQKIAELRLKIEHTKTEVEARTNAAALAQRALRLQQPISQPTSPTSPNCADSDSNPPSPTSPKSKFRRNMALNNWQNARVSAMRERLLTQVLGEHEQMVQEVKKAEADPKKAQALMQLRDVLQGMLNGEIGVCLLVWKAAAGRNRVRELGRAALTTDKSKANRTAIRESVKRTANNYDDYEF
eukprot:TRINITY_DN18624_c0_g1_i4.p1 TRINITY_DN18624_c0_g1~~TRINITY_DN18624_c0_g1_i4.p1  ORF type:complete len:306 (-),score=102.29 TRINITY_DN18624_c0_g1_i4:451-1368(-)